MFLTNLHNTRHGGLMLLLKDSLAHCLELGYHKFAILGCKDWHVQYRNTSLPKHYPWYSSDCCSALDHKLPNRSYHLLLIQKNCTIQYLYSFHTKVNNVLCKNWFPRKEF